MAKVLVCDHVEVERLALGQGLEVDYMPEIGREELMEVVEGYDAIVVRSRTKVDRELLDRAVRLKLVARPGTGLDNIDVEYAKAKGVQVVNSPESLVEAVAEHVILLLLSLSRQLPEADLSTKAGRWEKNYLTGVELRGRTLGIVGLGRIGRRIAEVAKSLGMAILVYDVVALPPDLLSSLSARLSTLEDLLKSADYVTFHVPLTTETRHLVDRARLATMKKTAFLVNTSRGGVVDEEALAEALSTGRLGGAALDVFEREPPSGAILTAPHTILTPHIGGQTEEAQADAIRVVGKKIASFFSEH